MKIVDKAMSLPLVSSAYTEVTRMTSPYISHIPVKITETVTSVQNVAVDHVASAVEKVRLVETFTCIYLI